MHVLKNQVRSPASGLSQGWVRAESGLSQGWVRPVAVIGESQTFKLAVGQATLQMEKGWNRLNQAIKCWIMVKGGGIWGIGNVPVEAVVEWSARVCGCPPSSDRTSCPSSRRPVCESLWTADAPAAYGLEIAHILEYSLEVMGSFSDARKICFKVLYNIIFKRINLRTLWMKSSMRVCSPNHLKLQVTSL